MMRFAVLGAVRVWAPMLERLCLDWGLPCLCDGGVRAEAQGMLFRSVGVVCFAKLAQQGGTMVAEPLADAVTDVAPSSDAGEWMYVYERDRELAARYDVWRRHNDAVALWAD
eukprot:gene872-32664_t